MFTVVRLFERRPGVPHQAIALAKGFDTAVDGVALDVVVEQLGVFEGVGAVHTLEAVHDPRHVTHAGDHLGLGEQVVQRRHAGAPLAIGVEHHRHRGAVGVIGIEQPTQQAAPGIGIDDRAELAAGTALPQHAVEQSAHGAAHASVKARVLQEDRRQQRRTGTGQTGNKVILHPFTTFVGQKSICIRIVTDD